MYLIFRSKAPDELPEQTKPKAKPRNRFYIPGAGAESMYDPYWSKVTFLTRFQVSPGTIPFGEEKFGVSAAYVGNAQIVATQYKFPIASASFDGTGDALTFSFGVIDQSRYSFPKEFTVEGWSMYQTAGTFGTVASFYGTAGNRAWSLEWDTSTHTWKFKASLDGTSDALTIQGDAGRARAGQWYHWAVDRDAAGIIRIYVDGVRVAGGTLKGALFAAGGQLLSFGMDGASLVPFNGYLDSARITKDVCRYGSDSGFIPPTIDFPTTSTKNIIN